MTKALVLGLCFAFGVRLQVEAAGNRPSADGCAFRGIWTVEDGALICSVWNISTNRCLLPFSHSGKWQCWSEVLYRLHELDFPMLKNEGLRDEWFSKRSPFSVYYPDDDDIILFPLNPVGNSSELMKNQCVTKSISMDSVMLKSAKRQLETPKGEPLVTVTLDIWYVPAPIGDQKQFITETVRLFPSPRNGMCADLSIPFHESGPQTNRPSTNASFLASTIWFSGPSENIHLPETAIVGDLAASFDRAPQIELRLATDDTNGNPIVLEFGTISEHRVIKSGDLVLCVAVSTNQIDRIVGKKDEVCWTTNSVESIDPGSLRGVQIVADENAPVASLFGLNLPVCFSQEAPCWILVGPDVSAESFPEVLTEGTQKEWNP